MRLRYRLAKGDVPEAVAAVGPRAAPAHDCFVELEQLPLEGLFIGDGFRGLVRVRRARMAGLDAQLGGHSAEVRRRQRQREPLLETVEHQLLAVTRHARQVDPGQMALSRAEREAQLDHLAVEAREVDSPSRPKRSTQ